MTVARPRPPATPRGRYWHVKAYARMARSMLLTGVVSFAVYHYTVLTNPHRTLQLLPESPGLQSMQPVIAAIGYDFRQPLPGALVEYSVTWLSHEPITAILVAGLVCTVALELHERNEGRER